MEKEIWTLICKDQHTPPYTKAYPYWYANILARSLEPFSVTLNVLTDEPLIGWEELQPKNILTHPITPEMYGELRFQPFGWWNKMLFYNKKCFPDQLVFVDLDSAFVCDPLPIFEYVEEMKPGLPMIHERAVFSWNLPRQTVASPLFYLDHRSDWTSKVWAVFARESGIPRRDDSRYNPVRMRGDQDFVEYALQRIFNGDNRLRDELCKRWPIHFYGRYKVIMKYPRWDHQSHHYRGLALDQFLCVGFNGRPKLEDIVKEKRDGWSILQRFISKDELADVGFVDPNARG